MYRGFYDSLGNFIFQGYFTSPIMSDYKPEEMTISNLCKDADRYRNDLTRLNQIWSFLKANRQRFSQVEFEFAAEHIGNYVTKLEDDQDAERLIKRTSGE